MMKRPALLTALLLGGLCAAQEASHSGYMTRIQRRASAEAATAANAVGELTYSVDAPGEAVLRVGTSDSGTVVVSDPCAIHVAPRRRLDAGEYSVTVSGDHTVYADGSILLATNVVSGVVTNVVTVRPVDPAVALASVSWDLAHGLGTTSSKTNAGDVATLAVRTTFIENPPIGGEPTKVPGWSLLRGVEVWAWTTDRRSVELDTETHPVPFRDALGSTSLWDLRSWVTNRYDWRTAEHWSEFPASDTVRLAGRTVHWSAGGALRSEYDSGAWTYYASGVPVIRVVSGVSTNSATDELKILALELEGTNALVYVSASLGVPVYIDSAPTLDSPYTRVAGQTSTYPSTVTVKGLPAYRITVPLDPAATAAFYRATATIDNSAANRAVHIGGEATEIYIDGVRAAWTNITINGATLRVLAAQP